jgi:hypothetical protein
MLLGIDALEFDHEDTDRPTQKPGAKLRATPARCRTQRVRIERPCLREGSTTKASLVKDSIAQARKFKPTRWVGHPAMAVAERPDPRGES